jgi:hypothetical protein
MDTSIPASPVGSQAQLLIRLDEHVMDAAARSRQRSRTTFNFDQDAAIYRHTADRVRPASHAGRIIMETLYLVLMLGVTLAILATMFEAIKAVSSKPIWERTSQQPAFVERRKQNLPYVGVERRKANRAAKAGAAGTGAAVEKERKVA